LVSQGFFLRENDSSKIAVVSKVQVNIEG
jgi:hypothetical protein